MTRDIKVWYTTLTQRVTSRLLRNLYTREEYQLRELLDLRYVTYIMPSYLRSNRKDIKCSCKKFEGGNPQCMGLIETGEHIYRVVKRMTFGNGKRGQGTLLWRKECWEVFYPLLLKHYIELREEEHAQHQNWWDDKIFIQKRGGNPNGNPKSTGRKPLDLPDDIKDNRRRLISRYGQVMFRMREATPEQVSGLLDLRAKIIVEMQINGGAPKRWLK